MSSFVFIEDLNGAARFARLVAILRVFSAVSSFVLFKTPRGAE